MSGSDIGDEEIDTRYGAARDDILDDGTGADTLDGVAGSYIYLFTRGSDQDTTIDKDTAAANVGAIEHSEGVLPTDIKLEWSDVGLKLTVLNTLDSVTAEDWLAYDWHQGYVPGFGVEAMGLVNSST